MIKVAIFTPVWKRPVMRRAFLDHMAMHIVEAEKHGIDLSLTVAGSEGQETMDEALSRGFAYVETPNQPLGAKFNAALKTAMFLYEPDYVMVMGSDTFFLPSIWADFEFLAWEGEKYIGVTDLYMWDWRTNRAVYWGGYVGRRAGEPIGPCRMIHTSLIPEDCELYAPERGRNLDQSATRILPRAFTFSAKKHLLTSCKGDENITDISLFNQDELADFDHRELKAAFGL